MYKTTTLTEVVTTPVRNISKIRSTAQKKADLACTRNQFGSRKRTRERRDHEKGDTLCPVYNNPE